MGLRFRVFERFAPVCEVLHSFEDKMSPEVFETWTLSASASADGVCGFRKRICVSSQLLLPSLLCLEGPPPPGLKMSPISSGRAARQADIGGSSQVKGEGLFLGSLHLCQLSAVLTCRPGPRPAGEGVLSPAASSPASVRAVSTSGSHHCGPQWIQSNCG